jgi:hypothetical protein
MLHCLPAARHGTAAPLFADLDEHLVLASIFAGKSPAEVYVDDPLSPGAGFTWFKHRAFLGGTPKNRSFLEELRDLLNDRLIPAALAAGVEAMLLDFNDPAWQPVLADLLPDHTPILAKRQYFTCTLDAPEHLPYSGPELLPPGFEALPVDAALLARAELAYIDLLRGETCSERTSVEDFLAHSFGMCLVCSGELAAWCLSEYNINGRCEVGVATMEAYQRRGLGALVTRRFLAQAQAAGYRQVGWHCWARNEASSALARRVGLQLQKEHSVHLYLLSYLREADDHR